MIAWTYGAKMEFGTLSDPLAGRYGPTRHRPFRGLQGRSDEVQRQP